LAKSNASSPSYLGGSITDVILAQIGVVENPSFIFRFDGPKRRLANRIRVENRMSHDTLIHRLVRPCVRWIAPMRVTPNQLTTARLLTGFSAAILFACGHGVGFNTAGVMFLISMLFDRADGELARHTGQMSVAGYHYDIWSDCAANIAVFIGIGFGLSGPDSAFGSANIWIGGVAGFAIAVLFWELYVAKLASVQGYAFLNGRLIVDPDDAMVLIPILVWFGFAQAMLIAAAIIASTVALALAFVAFRSKHGSTRVQ
jgi:archaetidylinositol phosphate synthase